MYLARLTDDGELSVYELAGESVVEFDPGKLWFKTGPRAREQWRFGKPGSSNPLLRECGWAAIRTTARSAVAAVHALREHREAA